MDESLLRHDDGMMQRLQLLAWPDIPAYFTEVDRYPNSAARDEAFACYDELARLNVNEVGAQRDEFAVDDAVPFLRFTPDAQEAFGAWRADLEYKVRGGDLAPALSAHLAKYRGLIPRLALICHLASNGLGPVSLAATLQALSWADYLESHARRAYASIGLDHANAAQAIWRHIRKGDLTDGFTARDVQRKEWTRLGKKTRVAAGLEALLDADWLACHQKAAGPQGGRKSIQYLINPKALHQCGTR